MYVESGDGRSALGWGFTYSGSRLSVFMVGVVLCSVFMTGVVLSSVFDRGQWEDTCQCIVHLLKQLNLDRLTAEFFLLLLKVRSSFTTLSGDALVLFH